MAIDKVRPLKIENPAEGGTQTDMFPTEASPTGDHIATKGIAFNDDANFRIEHLGRALVEKMPDTSILPNYLANGNLNYIEYFNSTSSQVTANRIARVVFTYDVNLDPSTEVWSIYDTNGTTVLRTYTFTFTFVNSELTNITEVST